MRSGWKKITGISGLHRSVRHNVLWSKVYSELYYWVSRFAESALFQVTKNGTSSAQIYERTPKTSRDTPHNGGHLVHAFPFLGEYQANFEKSHIINHFGAIFPLHRPKTKQVVHLVNYRDMGLKIGTRLHDMVIQVVLKIGPRF